VPDNNPPTNVAELLAKVSQATGNIAKHRAAMAEVAAAAQVPKAPAPIGEVKH
jgi:hypothetical protein